MPPPARTPTTRAVTLADLVVLSLLCEGPRHGYDLWAELERRQVEKWASISRPQVYYSLRKLAAAKHIVSSRDEDAAQGPERRVFKPSESGRRMLSDALAQARWSTQRPPDPFLTWMVLSWQARPRDFSAQIARRQKFLEQQLEEDCAALDAVIAETSSTSDAAFVVRLGIKQFELELEWLADVAARHRPG